MMMMASLYLRARRKTVASVLDSARVSQCDCGRLPKFIAAISDQR